MAGIRDRVNYHWGSMLKAALISTLLGVGTELTTDSDDALVEALRYGTQDTINQTGRQVVQRQLGIPPTLTIRSEEHTSELQSLMRISYAVFCLKKKTHITHHKKN